MKRYVLPIGLLLLLMAYGQNKDKKSDDPEVAKADYVVEKNVVDTIVLRRCDFNKQIMSNGKLRAVTKSVLRFTTAGEIAEICTGNGKSVVEGEVIARLDPEVAELRLEQARLTLDKAAIDRTDALISFGYSDTTGVPQERLRVANTRSGYTSAINSLKVSQMELANTVLKAPFSGKIANLNSKIYERPTDEFCTLIDDRQFEVVFNLLESEMAFVDTGQSVKVAAFNNPEQVYNGTVTEINPLVDDKGMINVRAMVKNTDQKLLEGMNVTVLVENLMRGQLVVPKSAVVIRDNQEVLFRLGTDGKAMWTYVNVEMSNSDSHVISPNQNKGAELNENDVIITSGNLNLADGSEVETRK